MQSPRKPPDEPERLNTLQALNILDSAAEERFDRLTRLARRLFDVPIALVSLVDEDRQWFKSCIGLEASETARDISFCGHAILGDEVFLIPDASRDERFHDNPLVTGEPFIRFYAGCPLTVVNGYRLGTLCIVDRRPRAFDPEDLQLLRDLAQMAEQELVAVQLATTDELTLLSNRRGFEALSTNALSLCRRHDQPASLLFFDLNRFKQINDRLGHAAGDSALVDFAELLKGTFRESDVLGRLGGDEFAVLVTRASAQELDAAVQRLHDAVDQFNRFGERDYDIEFSVGAVQFDGARHAGIADLIGAADTLMYHHKRRARGGAG